MTNDERNPNKVYFVDSRIRMPETFVESGFVYYADEKSGTFT